MVGSESVALRFLVCSLISNLGKAAEADIEAHYLNQHHEVFLQRALKAAQAPW